MLAELHIKDFAIIDDLQVTFSTGLNVISGETGAGKSILIGAISLLLGDRASTDMIRSSEETATVEALFNIAQMELLKEKLKQMDFYQSDELIIKRIVSRAGKNKIYINGHIASLTMLSSISELLVNICSQHEHQIMLNKENHIDILDDFGGLRPMRQDYEALYEQYLSARIELREHEQRVVKRQEMEELYKFQLKEILAANIKEGEDETLFAEKKLIINAKKLLEYASAGYNILYGNDGSILEQLKLVTANIREIKKIDALLKVEEKDVDNTYYQLEELAITLRDYGHIFTFDPQRIDELEERLELLGQLKRKYGGSIEALFKRKADLEHFLEELSAINYKYDEIIHHIEKLRSDLNVKSLHMSQRRREIAALVEEAINRELHTLRMDKAVFTVYFNQSQIAGEDLFQRKGIDDVEFYLSTNLGEESKPLARIASGGELSRIILALKKVLANTAQVGTIIFDEVDSGIGGATAEIVGEKLKDIADMYQVLCITHLPQIACFGSRHFRVSKEDVGERTLSEIRLLSEEDRLDEISRMLAGVEVTEKTREHAREMLDSTRLHR